MPIAAVLAAALVALTPSAEIAGAAVPSLHVLMNDAKTVELDIGLAAKSSSSVEPSSVATACLTSEAGIGSELFSTLQWTLILTIAQAVMVNETDSGRLAKLAAAQNTASKTILAEQRDRLSSISGLCADVPESADKVRELREILDRADAEFSHL